MSKPDISTDQADEQNPPEDIRKISKGKRLILLMLILIPALDYALLLSGKDLTIIILWSFSLFALLFVLYLGKSWARPLLILIFIVKSIVFFIEGFHHLRTFQDLTAPSAFVLAITFVLSMLHAVCGFQLFSSESISAYITHSKNQALKNYIRKKLGED
ncbi:MAG: hypothetical protein OEZ36_08345 [Spirochaetota bacterium]|nr:hypothetical protein [Spirochaetota bacterium]